MPLPLLAAELRRADPDLYLLSLFAPRDRREALWALLLFHTEIAKTRDVVSDTTLGLIRLQWWRDEIGRIYDMGNCGQNPVLSTLHKAVRAYHLPREYFETLLYAREFDLEDVPPANMQGLLHYADFTTTPLFKLALLILGEQAEEDALRQVATDFALVRLCRAQPSLLSARRILLPDDLLVRHGLSRGDLFTKTTPERLVPVIEGVLNNVQLKQNHLPFFLKKISAYTRIHLKNIRKNKLNVFDEGVQGELPFFALRLAVS